MRRLQYFMLIFAAITFLSTIAPAHAADGWQPISIPDVGARRNDLTSISALSDTNIYVGGWFANSDLKQHPLIEHWNGSAWQDAGLPVTLGTINAVQAVTPTDVWAVGSVNNRCSCTLVLHFDGTRWSRVPSDNGWGQPPLNVDSSVASLGGTDVWVAGWWYDQFGGDLLLTQHDDGTDFSNVRNPSSPNGNVWFPGGIAFFSDADGWVVGANCDNSGTNCSVMMFRWNGTHWRVFPSASVPYQESVLSAVAGPSASDIWAVGNGDNGGTHDPTTQHFDGSSWRYVPAQPVPNGSVSANAVVVKPDDTAWFVGSSTGARSFVSPLIEGWNGSTWTVSTFQSTRSALQGIAWTGARLIAVGGGPNPAGPSSIYAVACSTRC